MNRYRIFSMVILLISIGSSIATAQFSPLRLYFEPGQDPLFSRYSWTTFVTSDHFLSPGGTLITDPFSRAEFDSFPEFFDDVVGVWTVTNEAGQSGTFEIAGLQQSDFQELELLSPETGLTLYSGQRFSIIVSPDDPNESGVSFFSPDVDVICDCAGDTGQVDLPFGIDSSTGRFSSFDTETRDDLIASAEGDIEVNSVTLVSLTARAELTIVAVVPGDLNLDGNADLLDVAPFIDLLTNGGFMPQADLNLDGVVNLLDIEPFIDLLTG